MGDISRYHAVQNDSIHPIKADRLEDAFNEIYDSKLFYTANIWIHDHVTGRPVGLVMRSGFCVTFKPTHFTR